MRVFAPDLNNLAKQLRFGVKTSGACLVTQHTPNNMSVDVAAGTVIFDAADVVVAGTTVIIGASDPSNDRIDLVVVNSAGTVSVIAGTPATIPKAATYDPAVYLPLARVLVGDLVTAIVNADITDLRIYNVGLSSLEVKEVDGTPDVTSVKTIRVTNGTLTDDGGGQVTISTGGSGIEVKEVDGAPDVSGVTIVRVSNGTLTDDGGGQVTISTSAGVNAFSQAIVSQTNVTITHNLGDTAPVVQVYGTDGEQITPDVIDITDSNNVNLQFNTATSGTVVIHGGAASAKEGGVATYLHTQGAGSATWTVTHNLNDLNPVIMVFDSSGNPVEPQSIAIVNSNQLTVTFGSSQTGSVRVLAGKFAGGTGTGDFLPDTDASYDIGSGALQWKDAFFSGTITASAYVGMSKTFDAVVAATGGDYTTLGAAITAGKKSIFIKTGTYTETANITLPSDCMIVGESNQTAIVNMQTNRLISGSNNFIQNLYIRSAVTDRDNFEATGSNITLLNCWLRNEHASNPAVRHGVVGDNNVAASNVNILNCVIYYNVTAVDMINRAGAYTQNSGSSNWQIDGCVFVGAGTSYRGLCISMDASNCTISNCYFNNCGESGIGCVYIGGSNITLSGLTYSSTAAGQVQIYGSYNTVTGVTCGSSSDIALYTGGTHCVIENCVFPTASTIASGSNHNLIANSIFRGGLTITGNYNSLSNSRAGADAGGGANTITVSGGATDTIITGCRTDAAISDGGTGTSGANNMVY